ncbi:hypothetical protein [Aureibacter tunicatorum]|uniref:Uncharacterized protein n=1 Tax=Aureibacter tunicatorum TaxID=866807 RepID=A0AAE3XKR4_9BACT|nr:hypothetical protein [Aureibacter tunicatorum]MDR6238325.1 hypothetical protein [Aureibacter tunicatorum]
MNQIFIKNATKKKVLVTFILTQFVYAIMLNITIPKLTKLSGMEIFDMRPAGYTVQYAKDLLSALGETGRSMYLYEQIPLDFIYPILFAISYSLLLAFLLKYLTHPQSKLYLFCWFPVFAGILDYIENFGVVHLLRSYPEVSNTSIILTNLTTIAKSAMTSLYFITLFSVGIGLLIKWLLAKNQQRIDSENTKDNP